MTSLISKLEMMREEICSLQFRIIFFVLEQMFVDDGILDVLIKKIFLMIRLFKKSIFVHVGNLEVFESG